MNLERIQELSDRIAKLEHSDFPTHEYIKGDLDANRMAFNMGCYSRKTGKLPDCQTVGCIAGLTVALWGDGDHSEESRDLQDRAAVLLGLSSSNAMDLFIPINIHKNLLDITPKEASAALGLVAKGTAPELAWDMVLRQ